MATLLIPLVLARQYQRNVFFLFLLVTVPFVFITLSFYITADLPITFLVTEGGERVPLVESMPDVHGAVMVPISAGFLAGVIGLFVMLEAAQNDSRLVVAGVPSPAVAASRLAVIAALSIVVTLVSIAVTLPNFQPDDYLGFFAGSTLVAVTYAFLGAVAALAVGRLGGAYLMFFVPMIDVGIFQDPMFISGEQPLWMKFLPGFGGTRIVLDAGFTAAAADWVAFGAAAAWLVGLAVFSFALFSLKARGS